MELLFGTKPYSHDTFVATLSLEVRIQPYASTALVHLFFFSSLGDFVSSAKVHPWSESGRQSAHMDVRSNVREHIHDPEHHFGG